jgi:hypothetical protein
MLTERWQKLTVAALAVYVTLLWSYALLGFPSEGQVCEYAKDGAQPHCTTHNFVVAVFRTTLLWVEHFHESLLVLGTFVLAGVVVIQIRDARKSAERQLRAYVFAVKIRIEFALGKEVVATLTVKNTGQTPAYDMVVNASLEYRILPVNSPISIVSSEEMSRTTLGPDQDVLLAIYSGQLLTADESIAIANDRAIIFVYGQIKYRTAFKADQTTDFRFLFDRTCALIAKGTMRIAPTGNKAT